MISTGVPDPLEMSPPGCPEESRRRLRVGGLPPIPRVPELAGALFHEFPNYPPLYYPPQGSSLIRPV